MSTGAVSHAAARASCTNANTISGAMTATVTVDTAVTTCDLNGSKCCSGGSYCCPCCGVEGRGCGNK